MPINPILESSPDYAISANPTRILTDEFFNISPFPFLIASKPTAEPNSAFFTVAFDDESDMIMSEDEDDVPYLLNIFQNHPIFNTQNELYTNAYYESIMTQMPKGMCPNVIKSTPIQIPVQTIEFETVKPFTNHISAVADSGSDIECINGEIAQQYKKHLKYNPAGRHIQTGNGPITVHQYLPLLIRKKRQWIQAHFYVLPQLPYKYLIGRTLIHLLGYKLTNKTETYIHHPQTLDDEYELDELACTNNPYAPTQQIDYNQIKIGDKKLESTVIELLQQYDIVAKNEWDSGIIPDVEFKIDWKEKADLTPWKTREYPIRADLKPEMTRQINKMQEVGLITKVDGTNYQPTYISPIFPIPKKSG